MSLILASSSLFRKALLAKLGIKFSVCAPSIDESRQIGESAQQLVTRLGEAKARAVAKTNSGLIIASDQVAVLDGEILTKPHNHQNALKQLQQSSGKQVIFLTSLSLLNTDTDKIQTIVEPFQVQFRRLSFSQIDHYLKIETPYNCAGSFKSEALGIALCERMQGDDPSALVGLPLIRLVKMLENEGIDILSCGS